MYSNYNPDEVMNIQEEIVKWAEKTVREYHEIASRKEVNLAYYTQSDLSLISEEPELMIVGINPGSGGTYKEQCENKNWSYLYNNNQDEIHLLKGNYCREEDKPSSWDVHKKWKYWAGLKRCLSKTNLNAIIDDDSKIIVTNASFFSTKKANGISDSLLIETIPYTLDLINITNPKHLIFLSGKSCFERLHRLSKSSNLIQFEYKYVCGNIYIGKLKGKLCVGIPHPTYKTNEELNLVSSVLPHIIKSENYESIDVASIQKECATQIKEFEERKKARGEKCKEYQRIDKKHIEQQIIQSKKLIAYDSKSNRFKINDKVGITITSKDGGCVELRTIDYDNKTKDFNLAQESLTALRENLKKEGYDVNIEQWIGRKLFSQFGKTDFEIIKSVLAEIEKLKDICKL